jgi:integrase
MASVRKMRDKYYSRVRWYDSLGKRSEKLIPLKTDKKSEAIIRNHEVERVEDLISQGENWEFGWMAEGGKPKLLHLSIDQAVEQFYAVKRLDNLKPRTFEAYAQGLNAFMEAVGKNVSIENVDMSEINEFKRWSKKRHSQVTTNLCLQKIKSFLIYCYDMGYIKKQIKIKMLDVKAKSPMYLTETNMLKLFSSDMIERHYRKAFYFYAITGCRLNEPFKGNINGNWLIIDSESSKTGVEREVQLNNITLPILLEMRQNVETNVGKSGHGSSEHTRRWLIKKYSRKFKACAEAEGFGHHKFHNLRDTYATRRWAVTGDIKSVSKELGHTTVAMTEKYTGFKLRRLMDDFPSLKPQIQARLDKSVMDSGLTELANNYLQLG